MWTLLNNEDAEVEFTLAKPLVFPRNNLPLVEIGVGEEVLWEGDYKGGEELELRSGLLSASSISELYLEFGWAPALSGYELNLDFGEDCILSGKWQSP